MDIPPPDTAFTHPSLPALPLADLIRSNDDLVARMKLAFGWEYAEFTERAMPLLERYAAFVHLLPSTAEGAYSEPGGLLRMGFETALYALQGTDAYIFSGRATISERRQLEQRWRFATFIAGLCGELHRCINQLDVMSPEGPVWSPYVTPLAHWLEQHRIDRYHLHWHQNRQETRPLGLFTLNMVVQSSTLRELAAGNSLIVPHMLASITGLPAWRDHNVINEIVRKALAVVVESSRQRVAERTGTAPPASHLERYLVDALRHLAANHSAWVANTEKSRLWLGLDGLYMVWPGAAIDIRKHLDSERLAGMPGSTDDLLVALQRAHLLQPHSPYQPIWEIQTQGATATTQALKLLAPEVIYSSVLPAPAPLQHALSPERATAPSEKSPEKPASARVEESFGPEVELALPPAEPQQMEFFEQTAELESTIQTPDPTPAAPAAVRLELQAPLRLPMAIRAALQSILHSVAGSAETALANVVPEGLFIPLQSFSTVQVAPPEAIRALKDCGMLVDAQPKPANFAGSPISGIVLAAKFVQGLEHLPTSDRSLKG